MTAPKKTLAGSSPKFTAIWAWEDGVGNPYDCEIHEHALGASARSSSGQAARRRSAGPGPGSDDWPGAPWRIARPCACWGRAK